VADTIVVAGSLAQRPGRGGHAWVFLQYLLGFRRLGWNVVFIDRLEPDTCVDAVGEHSPLASSVNLHYLARVMAGFDLAGRWAVLFDRGRQVVGIERGELLAELRNSAFLLNIMGYLDDDEMLGAVSRRVFLDIDPGFAQMWHALGLADLFAGHDDYVTVGENVGREWCRIPTAGIDWITTRPPVVLDQWPVDSRPWTRFTSVGSWRGPYDPIEYEGRTYGLRAHEFRALLDLPRRTAGDFEVALDIDQADADDRRKLKENGWEVVDPGVVAADPWRYRDYIGSSAAELMVAKNMYVQSNSGWFSDRSACYLASGRPVLAQDTGLIGHLPLGQGLLAFTTLDEAAAGVAGILTDYRRHARAARAVAEEHFNSDVVLAGLLDRLGTG
jgi:hypothetical protein